jgi:hypothetical protein
MQAAPRRCGRDGHRQRQVGSKPVQVEQVTQGGGDFPSERQLPLFDLGRDAVQGAQHDRVFLEPFAQAGEAEHFHDQLFAPESGLDLAYQRGELLLELLVRRFRNELDTIAQALARVPERSADRVAVQSDGAGRSHGMHLRSGW